METTPTQGHGERQSVQQMHGTIVTVNWVVLSAAILVVDTTCVLIAIAHGDLIEILSDFDAELPRLTIAFLRIPAWVYPIVGLVATAVLLGKERLTRHLPTRLSCNLFLLLLSFMFLGAAFVALFSPLTMLVSSVMNAS